MKTVNSIMKRILAVGLTVVLLAGSAPVNVYAESLTDPETPLVNNEGVEEDEVSSSVETTGDEVPGTEALDEPDGQTIDEQETETVSDEGAVSVDPEDELTAEEAVSDPDEVFLEEEELSSYDAVQLVSPDGNLLSGSGGAYSDLIPTADDDAEAIAQKTVYFNEKEWYIIEDNSTSIGEGTVTLLAKDAIAGWIFGAKNIYSSSMVKNYLDGLTTGSGSFTAVADVIADSDLPDVDVTGAKLFLLSKTEAEKLPNEVRKLSDTSAGPWWLRTPGSDGTEYVANGISGSIENSVCSQKYSIRPALRIDLSKVRFSFYDHWFLSHGTSKYRAVLLPGGEKATTSGGGTEQEVIDGSEMTPVIYTADQGYCFEPFSDITSYGITVTRTSESTVMVSGAPTRGIVIINVPNAVLNLNTYTNLIPTDDDDTDYLAAKQVTFGGIKWYIIEDNSATEDSVTLFPVECIGNASVFKKQWNAEAKYSTSDVKNVVDAMTGESGVLADVACAINTVNLKTNLYNSNEVFDTVSNVKCYLLDITEAEKLPENIRKCGAAPDSISGSWWLRSPCIDVTRCTYVYCAFGEIEINQQNLFGNQKLGVRPALQLDLSAVNFNPGSKEFTLKPTYNITLTGGANATASGGSKMQTVICGRKMDPVTFTANEGYYFEFFQNTSKDGITVTRNSRTSVTVYGIPSNDTSITVPDAKVKQPAEITTTPTAKTLTFNGKAQELVSAGEVTGGTLQYAIGNADAPTESYTTSIPTGINAGDYYVWYKALGDDVHKDTEAVKVTVSIGKATITAPDGITRTYPYTLDAKDSIDLLSLVPEDAGTVTYQSPEAIGEISYEEDPAVSGSILSYTLKARDSAKIGIITVEAQMQNYNDVMLIVNIEQIALGLYEKTGKTQYDPRPSKNLNQGSSFTLVPMFADGTVNKRVVWSSSNPDVATVTQDGKVTGIGGGETVITARSEETPTLSASCHVSVAEPVTSVTLDVKSYSFGTGEFFNLSAQVLPFTAAQEIKWSTSNTAVVIVCDGDGNELAGTETVTKKITSKVYDASALRSVKIKAVAPGSAKITAEAVDGSGKKATCSFTVGNAVPDFTITGKGGATVLAAGKTLAMTVDWGGRANTPKNTGITWKVVKASDGSDASSIATVSAKGVLTGLSEGTVKVIATSTANPAKCAESPEISVYVPIKSVALNMTSATISTADNSNAIDLSVGVVSVVAGQSATGETLGQPVTVSYALDPAYSESNNKNYNKTKNYHKYIKVTADGKVSADSAAMAGDGVTSLSKLNVLATVRGYNNYTKVLTCKVSVAAANPLKSLKLSKTSLSLGEGNTFALTATLSPINPDGDTGLIWECTDNPNVSVDNNGVVTVNKYEPDKTKATITVKTRQEVPGGKNKPAKPLTAICKVTVIPSVSAVGFTNTKDNNRLIIGKTFSIKTAFTSSVAGKKASTSLVWSSSDESVATVSQKGVVKAVGNGTATITATSADTKKAGAAVPAVSAKFEIYSPVTKLALDKTKLTLGTQAGCQYGKVSVSALLPVDVSDPSVEWKTNNELVKLAAVDKGLAPSTGDFVNARGSGLTGITKNATGTGVTVGSGQYLAVQAVAPGVVDLTGIAKDGSGKKVTCTVTVRGQVTGLTLAVVSAKNGVNDVTLADNEATTDIIEYTGKMKANTSMTLTPLFEINGIPVPDAKAPKAEKNLYNGYKKYTDTSISCRSSDTSVATVTSGGKISVKKTAKGGDTATITVVSADGKQKVQITITVQ